jgi:putative ABC transport system permease protein
MRLADVVRHAWRDVFHRGAVEADLRDELAACVDLLTDERVRAGEPPDEARRRALIAVGGATHVTEAVRDTRRTAFIESVARDARFAIRTLIRSPAFTVTAVLTLGLGLGGAAAIFSVVDTVLVRPLPGVRDPATLVSLDRYERGAPAGGFGYPDYADYRAAVRTINIAASVGAPFGTTIDAREPERLRGALVSGNYFATLGVRATAGRLLSVADDSARAAVVVISHGLWERAFGADDSVVGKTIRLDEYPFTIVGVAEPDFGGTNLGEQTDAWAPLALQPVLLSRMSAGIMRDRSAGWLELFGRLAPGATSAAAQGELSVVAARLAADFPTANGLRSVRIRDGMGLGDEDRRSLRQLLSLMTAGTVLLLLMACANVAGLLVVRAHAREREMAVRLALGGDRPRVARQLLVEAAVLTGAAGIVGVGIARALAGLATTAQPAVSLLHRVDVAPGPHVAGAVGSAIVVVAVVLVLAPALRLSRLEPMSVLRDGRSGARPSRAQARRVLVGAQVALSLALLSSSGVVALAVKSLLSRNPGFDGASLTLVNIDLTAQGYGADRGLSFYRALIARLGRDSSFTSTSFAKTVPPLDWSDGIRIFREGDAPAAEELRAHPGLGDHVYGDHLAPGFFGTLGVRMIAGREFTQHDDATTPRVGVVNESLARMLWPNESVIGKRIEWPSPPRGVPYRRLITIVGVVADHQYTSLTAAPSPILFYPVLQAYDGRSTLVARTGVDAHEALSALRRAVHDVDPSLPVTGAQTMTQRMQASVWPQRLLAVWLGVVGALALAISFIGLYGVVAQIVGQRVHEISLRLALGASPARVIGAIVCEGTLVMVLGLCGGVPLAYLAVTRVQMQLEGMHTSPVVAAVASAGVIAAIMLIATVLPAWRVANLSPVDALRAD